MADEIYEEKRSYVRMKIDTVVSFTIKGKGDQSYQGKTQNLSASGLKIATDVNLALDDEIELILESGSDKFPPFTATGQVVRCEEGNHAGKHIYEVSLSLSMAE